MLEGQTKVTKHQFGGVHAAVDGHPRLPFPALVVGESILWGDFAAFVDRLLELDVQWSKEYAGDLLDLVKRERSGETLNNVVIYQRETKLLLSYGSLVVAKFQGVVDVFQTIRFVQWQ